MDPCDVVMNPAATLLFHEQGHIMGPYETTVRDMKLIDFDPDLWADKITKSAVKDLAERSKPLFATVSGCGRGKSRACTEIRKVLLTKANVFSISITFNSNWPVKSSTDRWKGMSSSISFALSIVARMASMFYGKPLVAVHTKMMRSLSDISELLEDIGGEDIIQGVVIFMMTLVRKFRERVDTFVLIVDEVVAIENYFQKTFEEYDDESSTLRNALLQNSIKVPFLTAPLHVSLFITSLEAAYTGKTKSNRPIFPVLLADRLDKNRVTDIWVSTLDGKRKLQVPPLENVSTVERRALYLVAATLSDIPRLVEFVNDYLRDSLPTPIDGKTISDLFEMLFTKIQHWYSLKEFSSMEESLIIAIILKQRIRMDDMDLIAAISNSIITNTITIFGPNEYLDGYRASLLMIFAVIRETENLSDFGVTALECLSGIFSSLKESYEESAKELKSEQSTTNDSDHEERIVEGLILEKVVRYWVQLKLRAAAAATISVNSDGLSLLTILSLKGRRLIPPQYYDLFSRPRLFSCNIPTVQLMSRSYDGEAVFLNELEEVDYGAFPDSAEHVGAWENQQETGGFTGPSKGRERRRARRQIRLHRTRVVIIIPHSGEAWDIGLKIRFPQMDTDFYILIDLKSRREGGQSSETDDPPSVPKFANRSQYKHTSTVMGRRMFNFVYIYMSTYAIESRVDDLCILLGNSDTTFFLGPISDLYRALRVLFINE